MLKYIPFLLIFTLPGTILFAQTNSTIIAQIHRECNVINKDTGYKKVTVPFPDHLAEGEGTITGLFKEGRLKKINSRTVFYSGIETIEYFIKDGELIFVYEEFHSFEIDEKTQEPKPPKKERTFTGQYLFNNHQLIDYITTGHNRFEDDTLDIYQTLHDEAQRFGRRLREEMK